MENRTSGVKMTARTYKERKILKSCFIRFVILLVFLFKPHEKPRFYIVNPAPPLFIITYEKKLLVFLVLLFKEANGMVKESKIVIFLSKMISLD